MAGLFINFLKQFVTPLGFVALLLFFTIFMIESYPKTATWFIVVCVVIVAILGNPIFSTFFTRSMEWRYMPIAQGTTADAILVLAEGTVPADVPRQRVEVEDQADRLIYAATLYQQKAAPLIVVTGDASNTDSARTLLIELGVPADAILVQDNANNISEDVLLSAPILADKNVKHGLLVTSALQMDRAYFLFRSLGIEITPAPTDYRVSLEDWETLTKWDWRSIITKLMPTTEAFNQSAAVLLEYVSLTYYRMKAIF